MDIKKIATDSAKSLKSYISTSMENMQRAIDVCLEVVNERLAAQEDLIKALYERPLPVPEKGDPGDPGVVDMEAVKALVIEEVAKIPAPKDGKDGESGINGVDGKSVTLQDVEPLVVDYVQKAVDKIPAPKDGKDVEPSVVREMVAAEVAKIPVPQDGKSVMPDDVRPMVIDLVKSHVDAIPQPQDGRDGLDALDIQILPAINDLKTYPRGVYATHNGGLWKSFKQTDGMDGWECVVDGVGDISVDYDGERGFSVKMVKSSGKEIKKEFSMPMVIDRGVFREGQEYKKFDGVTFGGSFWISQKDAPEGKPGEGNSAFRLSVKRGRDATTTVKPGQK